MILNYLTGDQAAIIAKLTVIFLAWGLVLLACAIDLYFGIRKSKTIGEFKTHSYGLRQTVKKVIYYLALMSFMLLIDGLSPLGLISATLNVMPLASIFGAIVLVWTEFISVKEKAEEKYVKRTANVANELMKLAVENVDVMDKLKDVISKHE